MYQRLKYKTDFEHLQPGTLLIKYPLSGQPTDELDLSSPENFDLYELESMEDTYLRLLFRPDIESHDAGENPIAGSVMTFVIKPTEIMISENNWWHSEEG